MHRTAGTKTFYTALFDIRIKVTSQNVIADAISRGHMQVFFPAQAGGRYVPNTNLSQGVVILVNQKPQ